MPPVSVREDAEAALARLDGAEALGAVVARDDRLVLAAADALDADGLPAGAGPLWGRPVTVKDWIEVAGLPCEGEAAERTGHVPARDATAVARLRAAGALPIAKTQPGADHPLHGRCHHPLDPERSPGASSSGEGALVGSGASALGLGSDSGGSVRLPAAWCGVAGLKPSFGLVPDTGHLPRLGARHDGRTVIGPLARRVGDLWAVLVAMAGPDGVDGSCPPVALGDPAAVRADGLRVAVLADAEPWTPEPATAAAVDAAVRALVGRGAVVVDGGLPPHLDQSLDVTIRYWSRRSRAGNDIDGDLWDWDRLVRRLTVAAAGFDVVVGPTVAGVAPPHRPMTGEDYVFCLPWSLAGWPAVSVPAGADPATGLPLAVQVAAPRWHDHVAVAVAGWLEADLAGPRDGGAPLG